MGTATSAGHAPTGPFLSKSLANDDGPLIHPPPAARLRPRLLNIEAIQIIFFVFFQAIANTTVP
jgi:hypothetical protein